MKTSKPRSGGKDNWYVESDGAGPYICSQGVGRIATIDCESFSANGGREDWRIARLMRAAPRLRDACVKMLGILEQLDLDGETQLAEDAIDCAIAAINSTKSTSVGKPEDRNRIRRRCERCGVELTKAITSQEIPVVCKACVAKVPAPSGPDQDATVVYRIEIQSSTHEGAARTVAQWLRDPESSGPVLEVTLNGATKSIDVDKLPPGAWYAHDATDKNERLGPFDCEMDAWEAAEEFGGAGQRPISCLMSGRWPRRRLGTPARRRPIDSRLTS